MDATADTTAQTTSKPSSHPKLTTYFAYGSNLWLSQMRTRCPSSRYIGIARLLKYRWIINERGYANVVSTSISHDTFTSTSTSSTNPIYTKHTATPNPTFSNTTASNTTQNPVSAAANLDIREDEGKEEVYALVYTLTPTDESRLDLNEGVPHAYTKEYLECDFWSASTPNNSSTPQKPSLTTSPTKKIDTSLPPTAKVSMLIYIDRHRTSPAKAREEYVYRMNRGIEDALSRGVPRSYVDGVLRAYIPPDDSNEVDGEKKEVEEFALGQARRFRDESGVF